MWTRIPWILLTNLGHTKYGQDMRTPLTKYQRIPWILWSTLVRYIMVKTWGPPLTKYPWSLTNIGYIYVVWPRDGYPFDKVSMGILWILWLTLDIHSMDYPGQFILGSKWTWITRVEHSLVKVHEFTSQIHSAYKWFVKQCIPVTLYKLDHTCTSAWLSRHF